MGSGMDRESIDMHLVNFILAISKEERSMGLERWSLRTEIPTKDYGRMDRNMVKASIAG